MSTTGIVLARANESVSDFVIGYFSDKRLMKTGALLSDGVTVPVTVPDGAW